MRMRVLDDERPGYAQLAFDSPLDRPTLALSVRSLREGAFLGPGGHWQRMPHVFTAVRIGGDARSALFRVGPEIVNHLLELDVYEFAAADGSFRVEATWENAVPQMEGRHKGHSFYRETAQGPAARATGVISRPPTPSPPPERAPQEAPPPEQPVPEPPQAESPPHEPAPLRAEEQEAEQAAEPVEEAEGVQDKPAGFFARHRGLLLAAAGVVGLAVLAPGLYQFVPCDFPGKGPCVLPGEAEKAQGVRQCIEDLKAQHRSCDIQAACIQSFQSLYQKSRLWAEIHAAAEQAQADCDSARGGQAAEEAALREARLCAADNARKCELPGCYVGYLHKYGLTGIHKDEAQSEAVKLDQGCIEAEAEEEEALAQARQCAKSPQSCATPRCYADYLAKFGVSGKHRVDAQAEATQLDNDCNVSRGQQEEDEALRQARQCAKGPRSCETRCYADYFAKFGASGKHSIDAQAEAAQLDTDCNVSRRQQADEAAWRFAKSCAAGAAACAVKYCYAEYRDKFGNGKHSGEALQEIARADDACRQSSAPAVADGRYSARTLAACGNKQDYFPVEVKTGRVSWEHEFLGIKYKWEGTVDAAGNVTATVANFPGYNASGHFTESGEKNIRMYYPHCAAGPVTMEIIKKLQ